MSYWEYREGDGKDWTTFGMSLAKEIEHKYSHSRDLTFKIPPHFNEFGSCVISFTAMQICRPDSRNPLDVRTLEKAETKGFARWYWVEKKNVDPKVYSEQDTTAIEEAFQNNEEKIMIGGRYEIDFNAMTQTNTESRFLRPILRRIPEKMRFSCRPRVYSAPSYIPVMRLIQGRLSISITKLRNLTLAGTVQIQFDSSAAQSWQIESSPSIFPTEPTFPDTYKTFDVCGRESDTLNFTLYQNLGFKREFVGKLDVNLGDLRSGTSEGWKSLTFQKKRDRDNAQLHIKSTFKSLVEETLRTITIKPGIVEQMRERAASKTATLRKDTRITPYLPPSQSQPQNPQTQPPQLPQFPHKSQQPQPQHHHHESHQPQHHHHESHQPQHHHHESHQPQQHHHESHHHPQHQHQSHQALIDSEKDTKRTQSPKRSLQTVSVTPTNTISNSPTAIRMATAISNSPSVIRIASATKTKTKITYQAPKPKDLKASIQEESQRMEEKDNQGIVPTTTVIVEDNSQKVEKKDPQQIPPTIIEKVPEQDTQQKEGEKEEELDNTVKHRPKHSSSSENEENSDVTEEDNKVKHSPKHSSSSESENTDGPEGNKEDESSEDIDDINQFYDFGDVIGAGSFAEVKKGKHKKKGTEVAIKIIPKDQEMSDADYELIDNELRVMTFLAQVKSEYCLCSLKTVDTDDFVYIVMPLAKCSVFDIIEQSQEGLSSSEAASIMFGLLEAIEFLHQYSVCHRDIKPENILIMDERDLKQCKLADYGSSKYLEDDEPMSQVVGTEAYMAPEIRKGSYTLAVDYWSAGVVAYVLTANCDPWTVEETNITVQIFEEKEDFEYLEQEVKERELDPDVIPFIKGLMCRDVDQRWDPNTALEHNWILKNYPN
eukprot:TRINITY_DN4953_c0_g1_i8.p1 TRINITY_DN4953_c0_g1~~TRINITY_DN4953_c0_g1_i8.p1  ORF type:complete len:883 (-),score=181.92 TRINITY_DN4953_c0_g1_i8:34-2682(-)